MTVFKKTTKRGVSKHRNYTNKRGSRRTKHTGGRLYNNNTLVLHHQGIEQLPKNEDFLGFFYSQKKQHSPVLHRQRNTKKLLRTKDLNDVSNLEENSIWVAINENIAKIDGLDKKVNEFKNKIGNVKGKIVYGKFWMTGCIHCEQVKDTWNEVVRSLENDDKYVNVDILSDNIEEGKKALKEKTRLQEDIKSDGFPQFYKIIKGHIYYYSGNRNVVNMKDWLTQSTLYKK